MARAAIQLYTLRNVDRPFTEILENVSTAGFQGVEFAYRVGEEDPDEVATTLEDTGLDAAGAHVPIDVLEEDLEETVEFYDVLGCTDFVVPSLDGEYFSSEKGVRDAVDRLAGIEDDLDGYGIDLHYHNHSHEFVDLNGKTGFDAFVDESEFGIELDLGLALAGGDNPAERLEALGDRSRLVHVKDVDTGSDESVPLGEGDLDLEACTERARANDSEWLIYEYEGEDPLASLEDAATTVLDHC